MSLLGDRVLTIRIILLLRPANLSCGSLRGYQQFINRDKVQG